MGDEEDRSSMSHADTDDQSGHADAGQVGNNVNAGGGGGGGNNATITGNQV